MKKQPSDLLGELNVLYAHDKRVYVSINDMLVLFEYMKNDVPDENAKKAFDEIIEFLQTIDASEKNRRSNVNFDNPNRLN